MQQTGVNWRFKVFTSSFENIEDMQLNAAQKWKIPYYEYAP